MTDMLPLQASELCPLTVRLLPKELSHAFGIADDTYDSEPRHAAQPASAALDPVNNNRALEDVQARTSAGQQQKRKAPDQQAAAVIPPAAAAGITHQPAAYLAAQTAPVQSSSAVQGQSASQQQTTSSISAGLPTAGVAGSQMRSFPAAYISPHTLLPYNQQVMAALPHLSGALPVAMYSPADISTIMALQQQQQQQHSQLSQYSQQQQQQQQHEELPEEQARAVKRPRLVWTAQLHKLFEEAVLKIGVNKAVPKTIMQMMNVDGLTRENVASHLQKYRLSLKKGPDGEFVTTVTEGTETITQPAGGSAGGTTVGAAQAAVAADTTATAEAGAGAGNNSSDGAGGSAGGGTGVSSDAGTGAVAGTKGDVGAEAGSEPAAAAAAAGRGGGPGAAGELMQQPATAAAVVAATAALEAEPAADEGQGGPDGTSTGGA